MRLRKFLRKVHRWIGVIASIWLLLLATTGFLLQHKEDWNLDKKYTNSRLLLSLYSIGEQYISYQQDTSTLAQLDKQIFINSKSVIKLEEEIIGAVYQQPNWVVATKTQIYWLDEQGQLLQSMDEIDGITTPIIKLGRNNQEIIIQNLNQNISLNNLENTNALAKWSKPNNSQEHKNQLIQQTSHNYLSYQQLIFDLHAGITSPSLINDLAALALIFLSISGIIIFFKKSFKSQKPTTKIK